MELTEEQKAAIEQQKAQCPFCQIIAGKIPSKKVYEDDQLIAILDINPASKGHVLLMPKEHYPIMPLIPPETFKHLAKMTKELTKCMKKALLCNQVTVFVANGAAAGQQSAHFMMHLIPREEGDKLDSLTIPQKEQTDEDKQEILEKIKPALYSMLDRGLASLGYKEAETKIPKLNTQQLIDLINQNPTLKQLIEKNPEQFKQMAKTHPQLKDYFGEADLDAIVKHFHPEKKKTEEEKKEEAKEKVVEAEFKEEEEGKEEEKPEEEKEGVNLDDIAEMFK